VVGSQVGCAHSGDTQCDQGGEGPVAIDPVLEWAVLADPFGNEFCLIREL
jgi:hypothetical protein